MKEFLEIHKEIVLKPLCSFGSKQVMRVKNVKEIEYYFSVYNPKVLLSEKYIKGQHLSVETFSNNFKHSILTMVDREICDFPFNVSTSQMMPANIEDEMSLKIGKVIQQVLNIVKIEFGPAHIEIIISPDKNIKIVEMQTRPGGRIHSMLKYLYDINLFKITLEELIGNKEHWNTDTSLVCGLFYLIPQKEGKYCYVDNLNSIIKLPQVREVKVNCKEEEYISGKLEDTSDRKGHIIVLGEDYETVYRQGKEISDNIEFLVE